MTDTLPYLAWEDGKPVVRHLPASKNFSTFPTDEEGTMLMEPGAPDPNIENGMREETLLFMLKALPKDRYRVIALMLFLGELGYEFRYEDIASIWGHGKVSIFNTIQRMKKSLAKAGLTPPR